MLIVFSHQQESNEYESTLEKMKSAYQLMGLMYDLKDTNKIRKASVCYKKRFSQIRFQNRILRLQKPLNKHIYFDDDDEPCNNIKVTNHTPRQCFSKPFSVRLVFMKDSI